jgi:hypothetical protein
MLKSRQAKQSAPFVSWWFVDFPDHNKWFMMRCKQVLKGKPLEVTSSSLHGPPLKI